MKLDSVTAETIKDITNSELTNLHWRIHQLWAQKKYKKMNVSILKSAHTIVIGEMKARGLNHIEDAMKKMTSKLETYLEGLS